MALSNIANGSQVNNISNITIARPRGIQNFTLEEDIIKDSYLFPSEAVRQGEDATSKPLSVQFVNNFEGGQVNAYLTGLDSDNAVVFVAADGTLIYPSSGGSHMPVSVSERVAILLPQKEESIEVKLPRSITSARIYFCEGKLNFYVVNTPNGNGLIHPSATDPNDLSFDLSWGFVELTYTADLTLYANLSFVDFVGMVLGMQLSVLDGSQTQITCGLRPAAIADICRELAIQTNTDSFPWSNLCVINQLGRPIRVLSPSQYSMVNPTDFEHYWSRYIDRVWEYYATTPLIINTQTEAGNITCRVTGNLLTCDGDNRDYEKPTALDIWGCDSGPFGKMDGDNIIHTAVIPRLCSAFVRSTLLLEYGNIQPSVDSSQYYRANPTNHYSRLVHKYEIDGKGYTYAYDDVNPDHEDASGTLSSGAADTLTIFVGAPASGCTS
ncbi:glycoside hydrolase family 64 protein [Stachybotrys elegans]|uniref:Glycoside hydrolase family 64 protein n=1 Tax=Stachybotrys elegans TaxID=80388 RepID=A0A8K0SGX9_9HYPO|nr:glycoside hydrolase family 64 protein [Stachybotrys elegans]